MKRMTTAVACATLVATATGAAFADEPQSYAVERFHLALGPGSTLSAESGEVPSHLSLQVNYWLGFAKNPVVIRGQGTEPLGQLVAQRLGGELSAAVGLYDWVQIGLVLPMVVAQGRPNSFEGAVTPLASLDEAGLGDLLVEPKVRVLREQSAGVSVAVIPAFTLPTGSAGNYFGESQATFRPRVAVSRSFGPLRLSGNLGYMLRPDIHTGTIDVGDELFGQLAVNMAFMQWDAPVEGTVALAAATPTRGFFADADQTHLEVLGGLTVHMTRGASLLLAGGAGLRHGVGTPDYRALAGVRFDLEGYKP